MSEYIYRSSGEPLTNERGEISLALAGEIVRCRDCKYYNEKTYKWLNGWTRISITCAEFDGCYVTPDGFCAWGERK